MPSDNNEFAPPPRLDAGTERDAPTLAKALAISGFLSAFVLLFFASYENWSHAVRLPIYALIGVSSTVWQMRARGRKLPLPGEATAFAAHGGQPASGAPRGPGGAGVDAAGYPELGVDEGHRGFVVPMRADAQRRGMIVALAFCLGSLAIMVVTPFPTNVLMALGCVFFGYLGFVNVRGLKVRSAYSFTPWGLTVRDAAGTLSVAWSDVTGVTVGTIGRTPTLRLETAPDAVRASGSARRWRRVNRALGAELMLRPAAYVGGIGAVQPLLMWCLTERNRPLIGTPEGRADFWQLPVQTPSPTA